MQRIYKNLEREAAGIERELSRHLSLLRIDLADERVARRLIDETLRSLPPGEADPGRREVHGLLWLMASIVRRTSEAAQGKLVAKTL